MYNPPIQPKNLEYDDSLDIKYTKFIGLDIIVDRDGTPYLLDVNSIPFLVKEYCMHYGNDMIREIVSMYGDNKIIGINVIPEHRKPGSPSAVETTFISEQLDVMGIDYFLFDNEDLGLDSEGLYVKENGNKRRIDVLFNRLPKAAIYKKIPKHRRKDVNLINPPGATFVIDKYKTTNAVKEVVPCPETSIVNDREELFVRLGDMIKYINEKSAGYDGPKMILKPLKKSNAIGINIIDDDWCTCKAKKKHFPYVLQERISSYPYKGFETDIRAFFINGEASNGFAKTAPAKLRDKSASSKNKFITSVSHGGLSIKMSQKTNSILKEYVTAVGYLIEEAIQDSM